MTCLDDSRYRRASVKEMFEGVATDGQSEPYAEQLVGSLRGKLLLMHGLLDSLTPAAGALRLIGALQKANKDFDVVFFPKAGHEISGYALCKTWDYLVAHMQGQQPPKEFELTTSMDILMGRKS